MNKILVYIAVAILLGTVTMVAPLAMLAPSDSIPDTEPTLTVPEPTEPSDQQRGIENGGTFESGDLPNETWTKPEPEPSVPIEPSEPSPQEPEPTEPCLATNDSTENPSDLSPIGLMTIPSFLVALGVFVYLRKRIS